MSDGFRSRVTTNVVPLDQRDPAAQRSGVAQGLSMLGEALGQAADQDVQVKAQVEASDQRIAMEIQRRQRSATVADRMGAWPDVQVRTQNRLDDLRNSWKPVDGDYQTKAAAIVDEELEDFKDSLGADPEVKERFAPLLGTFAASTKQGEQRWSMQTAAKAEGQSVEAFGNVLRNGLLTDPTPLKLKEAFASLDPLIDGLDAPQQVRDAVRAQQKAALVGSFLDGRMATGDWAGTRAILNSGELDATLRPEDKKHFLQLAENGEQTAKHQVELQQSAVRDTARDAINAVEAKVKAGIAPTPTELLAVQNQAKAAGLDAAELITFGALSIKATVNRNYAGADPATMRRDRDRLATRMAAGTASETEQVMKAQLDDLVDDADTKEAAQFKDLVAQGPGGTLQALASLSGTTQARGEKAERLGKGLGLIATLGPASQNAIVHGRTIREARPKDFGDAADARQQARAMVGDGMAGMLGGRFDDVAMAAWDYMTFNVSRRGSAGWDDQQFRNGMQAALGATLRPNGALQGGVQRVHGSSVWLPETMTAQEFDTQLARTDFAGAVYAGGKAVDKADVLANYHPVYVSDDDNGVPIYYLYDRAGGVLNRKDGRPFSVRPRVR